MKKTSVVALILMTFWLVYVVHGVGMYFVDTREYYQAETDRRKNLIDLYLDLSAHFLMNQKVQSLIPRLEKARELYEFDFFLLRKKNEVVAFYNHDQFLEGINHDYQTLNLFQETEEFSLKTIAIYDYKLTIGINKTERSYFWEQLKARKNSIIQDVIVVTFLVFLILYFLLKDIVQISKVLQNRNRSSLGKIKSISREAEIMIQATGGFEKFNESLRHDNLLLSSNLAPAIQNELKSGLTPPYSFSCTVARVDLNGYTQLFMQKSTNDLMVILSQYFQQSRDIIERYDGLIYQYVGDETIFLFKGEDSAVTAAKALSAIRSLFEVASRITSPAVPHGLRLKASLVTGELQFVKLDGGHAFSGLPLIETVRMLGQVSEKTENSLIFYAESLEHLSPFCEVNSTKTTVFKGFQTESHLLEVRRFLSLDDAIEFLPLSTVAENFRSDGDLVGILKELKKFLQTGDAASFDDLISPLRTMQVREVSPLVTEAYRDLLKTSLDMKQAQVEGSKSLAMIVSLSQILFQPDQIDAEFEELFDLCERAQDPRVQANTLIIKSLFGLESKNLSEKMNSSSNRLAADAILVTGQQEFDLALAERVGEFLKSGKPRFVASALFLIAELIQFHHRRDLVYLKANSHLRSLALEIPKYLKHEDEMVQKRAQKSHDKIQKLGLYEN